MRLVDEASGEIMCTSCPTYGTAARDMPGNEQGYLVEMNETVMAQPKMIQPGQIMMLESVYDASVNHYGVMALAFLDLVGFDSSCPGPVRPDTGRECPLVECPSHLLVACMLCVSSSACLPCSCMRMMHSLIKNAQKQDAPCMRISPIRNARCCRCNGGRLHALEASAQDDAAIRCKACCLRGGFSLHCLPAGFRSSACSPAASCLRHC